MLDFTIRRRHLVPERTIRHGRVSVFSSWDRRQNRQNSGIVNIATWCRRDSRHTVDVDVLCRPKLRSALPISPLFLLGVNSIMRTSAVDLFGGTDALARKIFEGVRLRSLVTEGKAVEALKGIGRQEILSLLDQLNPSLDELVHIEWQSDEKAYWMQQMQSLGGASMVAEGGAAPNENVALEVFVLMEALSTVCKRAPAKLKCDIERTAEMRKKYDEMLKTPANA